MPYFIPVTLKYSGERIWLNFALVHEMRVQDNATTVYIGEEAYVISETPGEIAQKTRTMALTYIGGK